MHDDTSIVVTMSYRDLGPAENDSNSFLVIPINQFERDAAEGFTSNNFDLTENIDNNDVRDGLHEADKERVRSLMSEGHDFDDARLELNRQRMRDAGVDPDTGLPLDPRAVTFENLRRITDTSRKAKFNAVMKRFGLTPRRVMVILLLVLLAYWVYYSDWAKAIGVVQPLIFGAEDIGAEEVPESHP